MKGVVVKALLGAALSLGLLFFSFHLLFANNLADSKILFIPQSNSVTKLLDSLVATETNPMNLIATAKSIEANKLFGDSVSKNAANFLYQKSVALIENYRYSSHFIENSRYRKMAHELQQLGVPVDIPFTSFQKVVINLKQKNYTYLVNRMVVQLKMLLVSISKLHPVLLSIFIAFLMFLLVILFRKRKFVTLGLLVVILLMIGAFYGMTPATNVAIKQQFTPSTFSFKIDKQQDIGAAQIINEHQLPIGKLIWVNEKVAKFSYYFSPFKIVAIIDSLNESQPILLNTTASFINNNIQPVGITAIGGIFKNPLFHSKWDGLVLIKNNQLEVSFLAEDCLTNFDVYSQFCNEVTADKSDAFQVPLLVYRDSLLFDKEKCLSNLRENRFLLKIGTSNDQNFYLIADVESQNQLVENTLSFLNRLKQSGFSVQFMVLFDVGANNLFQVYRSNGVRSNHYRSTLPAERATNLLSIQLVKPNEYSIEP